MQEERGAVRAVSPKAVQVVTDRAPDLCAGGQPDVSTPAKKAAEACAQHEDSIGARSSDVVSLGVIHDINNLLHAAHAGLELIRGWIERGKIAETSTLIDKTEAAVGKASTMAKELLPSFSSRQADRQPTNVNEVIVSMSGLAELMVGPSVSLSYELTNDETTILCDRSSLENVMLNLLKNAKSATGGIGRIAVRTFVAHDNLAEATGYIAVCVSDDGIGMSPETVSKAFEPFYSACHTPSNSGIGLATVKSFTDELNGRAEIRSALGQGCSVWLYIPAHVAGGAK
jgi:signal transduction histidine kinase